MRLCLRVKPVAYAQLTRLLWVARWEPNGKGPVWLGKRIWKLDPSVVSGVSVLFELGTGAEPFGDWQSYPPPTERA